jgi:glycosyltransferase involved in cell wall biosynthesis
VKLLLVARRFPPDVQSGTETVFSRLHAEAVAAGHEVHLLAGFRRSATGFPDATEAVPLAGGPSDWLTMARAADRAARRLRPDVVLSNSIEVRVRGVPTVTLVHDLNFGAGGDGLGASARRLFYRAQATGLARIVAVSEVTRNALLALGVPPEKVVTIHNGVDLARFRPAPRAPDGEVRFVQVSRILPGKGQHCALDALARMRLDQRAGLSLAIVGTVADPVYAEQLRVQAWKLPAALHFEVPDVAPWYQQADIALFPTRMPEGFGYAAIEAMACGLPVVGFDDPAVREASGGLAVLVPRDDVPALRDAMLRLARDPAARSALGEGGRAFVQRYRWPDAWRAYERVLQEVVS